MMRPLYILSACSISPQHTYDAECFLAPIMSTNNGKLFSIDPDYTKYISPVAIRRMSRMLKQGITAGMKCLEDAQVQTPDAIILGTARGSVTDMQNFLKDMITMQEEALTPTGFIQSTYNSVNGWLAMLTKCTGYNQTYVHRGFSLELCLVDTQLHFEEASGTQHILAGGFDELTDEYFLIRNKIEHFKQQIPESSDLLSHYNSAGTIAGEGAHFFVLSNVPANAACAITAVKMLQQPTAPELMTTITEMLAQNQLTIDEIDVLVCGMNGDSRNRFLIDPLLQYSSADTTIAAFKQFSGEYDTACGFGLWLANYIFVHEKIPTPAIYRQGSSKEIRNILVCNVTIANNISLILLQAT